LSALPTLTDSVIIDGYSEAGASANTLTTGDNAVLTIELRGDSAGSGVSGLTSTSSGSTIKGLAINRFAGNGILLDGGSATANTVVGDFIGTDTTGTTALGNGNGVEIQNGASSSTIGGTTAAARNIISGNGYGVLIQSGG